MTFVYIALGVLLGIVLVPVAIWVFFKFFAKGLVDRFVKRLEKQIADMGALFPPVPPFRATLEPSDETEWTHPEIVEQATQELAALGYEQVGDFEIREMYQLHMRGMVNRDASAYAVVYDFKGGIVDVMIDMVATFTDDTGVTCSNAPIQGLDEPPWETKYLVEKKTEEGAIADIAAKLAEATAGQPLKPAASDQFVKFFQDAYARKMDWQVNRGGLTAEEIRRNMVLVHGVAEDQLEEHDEVVELTQAQWRSAIARFVSEKTRERFLRHVTKMSASQWEDVRDRLYIVHDSSVPEELVEELTERLMDLEDGFEEDHEIESREAEITDQLRPHFDGRTPREGFEAAQVVLPEQQRYKRIARITSPWPADVYVEPRSTEGR